MTYIFSCIIIVINCSFFVRKDNDKRAKVYCFFVCSISFYNLLIRYDDGISDALNCNIILIILLSLLRILQVIEFNFLHSFNLFFPLPNLTIIRSAAQEQ